MAIIPETYSEASLDIGRRPDTSGEAGNSMIFEAISNLANNTQSFATRIATDMHEREASLEAADKYAQYTRESEQAIINLKNDPNLKLYKNPKQIEEMYLNERASARARILDGATSWKAKNKLDGLLVGSADKEILNYLSFKDQKLKDESAVVANEMRSGLKQLTTDFNESSLPRANNEWKKFVTNFHGTFAGQIPVTMIDPTLIDAADESALSAVDIHLQKGEIVPAASAILGASTAKQLSELAHKNYVNGTPLAADPELAKIMKYKPEMEMLKKVSPHMQQRLMDMILQKMATKDSEDISLWRRQHDNVTTASADGTMTLAETDKALLDLDAALPNSASKVEAFDLIGARLNAFVNDTARKVRKNYNLVEKAEYDRFFKDHMSKMMDKLAKSGVVRNSLLKIGDGDINKGLAEINKPAMIKNWQEKLYKDFLVQNEKDMREFNEDPIKAAVGLNPLPVANQRLINEHFAYGKIGNLTKASPEVLYQLRETLLNRRESARTSMGGFTPIQSILTKAEANDLKASLNMQGSDSGQFVQLTNSLRLLGADIVVDIADQLGVKGLYASSLMTDPALIQQTGLALKDMQLNRKTAKMEKDEDLADMGSTIRQNKEFKKFNQALTVGDTTRAKTVSDDYANVAQALSLQLMSNGFSKDDAIKESIKQITGQYDIVDTTTWNGKGNYVLLPKGSNIDHNVLSDYTDDVIRNEKVWNEFSNILVPQSYKTGDKNLDTVTRDKLNKQIAKTGNLVLSSDGKNYSIGYIDDTHPLKPLVRAHYIGPDGKSTEFKISEAELRQFTAAYESGQAALNDPMGLDKYNKKFMATSPSELTGDITGAGKQISYVMKPAREHMVNTATMFLGKAMQQPIHQFRKTVYDTEFHDLKTYEGANAKNYNVISKTSRKLYGGLSLDALKDVDRVNKVKQKDTLEEYRASFTSQTVADKYFKDYLLLCKEALVRNGLAQKMDDKQREVASHLLFTTGYPSGISSGLAEAVAERNPEKVINIIKAKESWYGNFFDKKTGKLNTRGKEWLIPKLEMIRKR